MRTPVTRLWPLTITVSTWWLRLLRWFILVSALWRLRAPRAIMSITSSVVLTSICSSTTTRLARAAKLT